MNETPKAVLDRYNRAAQALAVQVDVDDRMTDPNYVCDRSPQAERLRTECRRESLAEYRAAAEALQAWKPESEQ